MSCNKTLFESNTRAAACSKLAYYSVPTPWKELGSEKLVCWKELGYMLSKLPKNHLYKYHTYVLQVFSVV